MAQQKIRSIRQQELIEATIEAVYVHGFADLTVAQIARYAQASTGSIHYYFGGKEELLEGTMRHLLSLLRDAHHVRLKLAETPESRLRAAIDANFDDDLLTREACRVWTQFWAFAPYHPKLARLHRINRARVRSNIIAPLRSLVAERDVRPMSNAIQGYMDGVWIEVSQSETDIDLEALQFEARRFLDHALIAARRAS